MLSIVKDVGVHMKGDHYELGLSEKADKPKLSLKGFFSLKSEQAKALVKALCLLA